MSEPEIHLSNVSLNFRLDARGGAAKPDKPGAVGANIQKFGGSSYAEALHDISIGLGSGARVGLVGINGSGKSTLLRLLAGIYFADKGEVRINGRVSTLFSTSVGMSVNATSRENIRDAALLMGQSPRAIRSIVDNVIAFADLGEYADVPMRALSTGMRARVGFGVATAMRPDILLIDEVMGTGDKEFQTKARKRVENLIGNAGIVVLASHSTGLIRQFCDSAIWLDKGILKMHGEVEDVLTAYMDQSAVPG